MNAAKIAISAFASGAAFMYLSDPARGKRRRAMARDKAVKAWGDFSDLADKAQRDLVNRTRGAFSELKAVFRDPHADDNVLIQRVKSRVGRLVSHPHAITASSQGGKIVLKGTILNEEVDSMLRAVRSVPGVEDVVNELEVHRDAHQVSSLQGGTPRESRSELMQRNWTPALRMAAGGLGGTLLWYGARHTGVVGLAGCLAGATLLTRAVTNREIKEIVGVGDGTRTVEFDKTVHIHAPVEEVFAFWSDYQKFPSFMTHLKQIHDLGNGKSHWVAKGPGGISVSWDAELTDRIPNKLLAWRSVPGSAVETEGVVRFDQDPGGGTRVSIQMFYKPPAGLIGHYVASLFGSDPKHEMDDDMVRLKSLIELGKTRANGTRVTLEDVRLQTSPQMV